MSRKTAVKGRSRKREGTATALSRVHAWSGTSAGSTSGDPCQRVIGNVCTRSEGVPDPSAIEFFRALTSPIGRRNLMRGAP